MFASDQLEDSSNRRKPGDKYLEESVHFAEAMSLITAVSRKHAQVRRFAPTELGRALSGAKASGDEDFFRYFLTKSILLADADALFPVMEYFRTGSNVSVITFYQDFQNTLRRRRSEWLLKAFPQPLLHSRVSENISWLTGTQRGTVNVRVETISERTARHHATPRVGWLQMLGILDSQRDNLTDFGESIRAALLSGDEYFWLGPPSTTQEELGLEKEKQAGGPFEDTYDLVSSGSPASERDVLDLVDETRGVMRRGYSAAKLVHAAQATLYLPIEYIKFRSFVEQKNVDWNSTLNRLFSEHRDEFERLTAKRGQVGFYKWKGRL